MTNYSPTMLSFLIFVAKIYNSSVWRFKTTKTFTGPLITNPVLNFQKSKWRHRWQHLQFLKTCWFRWKLLSKCFEGHWLRTRHYFLKTLNGGSGGCTFFSWRFDFGQKFIRWVFRDADYESNIIFMKFKMAVWVVTTLVFFLTLWSRWKFVSGRFHGR